MQPILTIVCGLPGSGKSEWITEHKSQFTFISDDFFKGAIRDENPGGTSFWYGRDYAELIVHLKKGESCCISDIIFCKSESRTGSETWFPDVVKGLTLDWLFFENDPDACACNIQRAYETEGRDPKERLKSLCRLKADYIIPDGARRLPVFRLTGT
jgi:hypothetical protein